MRTSSRLASDADSARYAATSRAQQDGVTERERTGRKLQPIVALPVDGFDSLPIQEVSRRSENGNITGKHSSASTRSGENDSQGQKLKVSDCA